MTAPNITVNLSATVNQTAGSIAVGDVLVPVGGLYVKATTANRTSGGRAHGIALTAWSSATAGAVMMQHVGVVDAAITGLGTGTASWVRVSALGVLERATVSGSDDVVGWCHTDGTMFALFGLFTAAIANGSGGGGTTPTGTGIPHVVLGVQNAAASLIVDADVSASAAIAASKVVQATGTGIPHVVAGVLTAASSLIVNADVNAAAAIAGSKVDPTFGAQLVTTTSRIGAASHYVAELNEAGAGPFNDYAIGNSGQLHVVAGAAAVTFTGFVAPAAGECRDLVVVAAQAGFGVKFTHESASSTAANRILINSGLSGTAAFAWRLRYSTNESRWYIVGYPV